MEKSVNSLAAVTFETDEVAMTAAAYVTGVCREPIFRPNSINLHLHL